MAAPDHAQHRSWRFFLRRRGRPHMAVRDTRAQTLATGAAPTQAGHLGREPCLVDKHQTGWVEIELPREPRLTRGDDVGPVLLGRVRGFF
jgi:hypothetical protein